MSLYHQCTPRHFDKGRTNIRSNWFGIQLQYIHWYSSRNMKNSGHPSKLRLYMGCSNMQNHSIRQVETLWLNVVYARCHGWEWWASFVLKPEKKNKLLCFWWFLTECLDYKMELSCPLYTLKIWKGTTLQILVYTYDIDITHKIGVRTSFWFKWNLIEYTMRFKKSRSMISTHGLRNQNQTKQ